jgi:hypothetical protein
MLTQAGKKVSLQARRDFNVRDVEKLLVGTAGKTHLHRLTHLAVGAIAAADIVCFNVFGVSIGMDDRCATTKTIFFALGTFVAQTCCSRNPISFLRNGRYREIRPVGQVAEPKKVCGDNVHLEYASGGRWDRPCLQNILRGLKAGDVLVVWKLDRLTRSLSDLLAGRTLFLCGKKR